MFVVIITYPAADESVKGIRYDIRRYYFRSQTNSYLLKKWRSASGEGVANTIGR